jgi:hypothetical protein
LLEVIFNEKRNFWEKLKKYNHILVFPREKKTKAINILSFVFFFNKTNFFLFKKKKQKEEPTFLKAISFFENIFPASFLIRFRVSILEIKKSITPLIF